MPLIKCKDCGHDISTEAPACPHCGRLTSKSIRGRSSVEGKYNSSGCLVIVIGVVMGFYFQSWFPFIASVFISFIITLAGSEAVKNMDNPD